MKKSIIIIILILLAIIGCAGIIYATGNFDKIIDKIFRQDGVEKIDKIAKTRIVNVSFDTAISSTKYFPASDQWNSYSDTNKLFFTEKNTESKLIKTINAEKLIKDLRKYSEEASPTVVILGRAISAPKEVFYFFCDYS